MTDARFGSRRAAHDNAMLCYGADSRDGREFRVDEDGLGWGWAPLRAVPEISQRDQWRTAEGHAAGRPQRGMSMRHRTRPQGSAEAPLHPVAA
jgi:hypothetical protein